MMNNHNPDILECLADLSNDEILTPPKMAYEMIELIPESLFKNPNSKFLDPFCKSGIFLRIIVEKLIVGLEDSIPNLEERISHILKNMVFGYSITNLTGYVSRRSVYCTKNASHDNSLFIFNNDQGNIRFVQANHIFINGFCKKCNMNNTQGVNIKGTDNHAYSFIHSDETIKEIANMKFDVIIGNPPYQLDSGGFGAQAIPIYHYFVDQAINLNAKYVCMIIPSRWYSGGMGLDKFRENMLKSNKIKYIVDYPDAREAFPSVEIKGGVMYFLWDRDYEGKCNVTNMIKGEKESSSDRYLNEYGEVFVRLNKSVSILNKIRNKKIKTLDEIVYPLNPFNLPTNFSDYSDENVKSLVKIYRRGGISHLNSDKITKNKDLIKKYKVLIPKATDGSGNYPIQVIPKPIIGEPNSACTMTYVCIGSFNTKKEAKNLSKYLETKLCRYLISLVKNTQDTNKSKFIFVPKLDFNIEWDDGKLFKYFKLTKDEISHINSLIKGYDE